MDIGNDSRAKRSRYDDIERQSIAGTFKLHETIHDVPHLSSDSAHCPHVAVLA